MDSGFTKGGRMCDVRPPQLLDLIPKDLERTGRGGGGGGGGGRKWYGRVTDDKKLELSLAPPGEEDWSLMKQRREKRSGLSLSLFPLSSNKSTPNTCAGAKRGFSDVLEPESTGYGQQQQKTGFLHFQATGGIGKEPSPQKKDGVKTEQQVLSHERMACSKSASPASPAATAGKTTAIHVSSQTRTSPAPVVGWPPVRSFRKNISSYSSKSPPAPENPISDKPKNPEIIAKGLFVKINMDGIPIGRKVDLKAYDNYEILSSAVDKLFRGLLAVKRENLAAMRTREEEEEKPMITGLLDGTGEYTLVYEDNEGDRMLVGDVPWSIFVSTVKRLRVLKSSDLSTALTLGASGNKNRQANDMA